MSKGQRTARLERETAESSVRLNLDLDGTGRASISTGVGFYDHMLTALAKHSLIDLEVSSTGDWPVDSHHPRVRRDGVAQRPGHRLELAFHDVMRVSPRQQGDV